MKTMKLVYCWITEYLNIKNQGFNFGSEWIYSTEVNTDGNLTISRKENDKYIPNFFELKSIGFENVTAVVGENGTGKSNILEYLGRLITTEDTGGIIINRDGISVKVEPKEGILIFTDNKGYTIIKSNGNIIKGISYKKYSQKEISGNHVIYYSPIYDFRNLNLSEHSHYSDISSNFLINKDSQNDISLIDPHFLGVEFHKTSDIFRQLTFLENKKNIADTFGERLNIPTNITIKFREIPLESDTSVNFRNIIPLHPIINKANDIYNKEKSTLLELKKGDNQKLIFLNFLKSLFASIIINADYRYIDSSLGFEKVTSEVNKIYFNNNYDYSGTQIQFESFLEIFLDNQTYFNKKSISDIIIFLKVSSSLKGNSDDYFTMAKADLDLIQLITKYEHLLKNYTNEPGTSMKIGFLDFQWKGMSSGEIAFLNLFSRLHEVHKKLEDSDSYPPQLYLLIDEGEQGFHFQWQKEYLKTLIEFIPKIFKDDTKIHLIFATHSPITLSDMPNTHIVFLKKDANNEVRVLTDNSIKNTFAANIHEILYDGFFMRNGFIGEFAVTKIDAVFDYIEKEKKKKMKQGSEYKLEKNKIYETNAKIISNIDEPLIRVKLEQGMIELEDYATELQKEITKLEAQQKLINERITKLREDDTNSK